MLTLGPRGISLFSRGGGEPFTAGAAAREVFDVSGAGDTVVAAFSLATAAGASAAESATFANRAAAIDFPDDISILLALCLKEFESV